jgi:hypothetical protein
VWVTLEDARAWWADAVTLDDDVLAHLLELAQDVCSANLPALPGPDDPIPARWQHAVVLHAQDTWQASTRDGDVIGFGDYAVRVRALGSDVLALLRPHRGPVLG